MQLIGKVLEKEKTAINALANNFEIDIKEIAERKANNERIHMESIDLVDELEAEFEKLKPQLASMPPAQRKYAIERMVLKVCTGMGIFGRRIEQIPDKGLVAADS